MARRSPSPVQRGPRNSTLAQLPDSYESLATATSRRQTKPKLNGASASKHHGEGPFPNPRAQIPDGHLCVSIRKDLTMAKAEDFIGSDNADLDNYNSEESFELIHKIASARRRLFGTLGWTVGGLLAVAVLGGIMSLVYMPLASRGPLTHPGLAGTSVLLGFGVFFVVKRRSGSLRWDESRSAKWLFWLTCVAYALIVNLFGGGLLGLVPEAKFIPWVLPSIVALLVALVAGIAIGIGYQRSKLRTALRWCSLAGLTGVMTMAAAATAGFPAEGLAGGFLFGLVIAWCTDFAVKHAIEGYGAPEPAIAACLLAGTSAVAIWISWLLIRYSTRAVLLVLPVVIGAVMWVVKLSFDIAEACMGFDSKR